MIHAELRIIDFYVDVILFVKIIYENHIIAHGMYTNVSFRGLKRQRANCIASGCQKMQTCAIASLDYQEGMIEPSS